MINLDYDSTVDATRKPNRHADFRILVVDDQATQRFKLKAAVEQLGFISDEARNGPHALQMMKSTNYALVLLDILMPDMDGFEVMLFMKRDHRLRDIPVIVISALESEMRSVVHAIEMGAEDFLPKQFNQVLLAARLDSALESRRAREREREQQIHVERLTQAAAIVESQIVNPDVLQLRETSARGDDIGKLSRVFVQMTRRIHAREAQLYKQIGMARTASLLVGIGLVGGSCVALAKEAVQQQPHPLGIVLWVNLFCACICLPIAAHRQSISKPSAAMLQSILTLGIFTLLVEVPILWAAQILPAAIIVLIMALESLLVIMLLLATRAEHASLSRIARVLWGVAAIVIAIVGARSAFSTEQMAAAAVLMIAPLAVVMRTFYWQRCTHQPEDTFLLVGSSTLAAALLIAPLAVYSGDLISLLPGPDNSERLILVIALLTVVTASTTAMRITLDRLSGPLLSARASLAIMMAGLIWSFVLHRDLLPDWGWLSCALFMLGGFDISHRLSKRTLPAVRSADIELS